MMDSQSPYGMREKKSPVLYKALETSQEQVRSTERRGNGWGR